MTNEQRTHKQAAKDSKTLGPRYVVYVFDQGYDVYDGEQARMWVKLINIEALYVGGVQVADAAVAKQLAGMAA